MQHKRRGHRLPSGWSAENVVPLQINIKETEVSFIMKYYESNFDEYTKAVNNYNLHPEIQRTTTLNPLNPVNKIYYGGSGVGKYSQALHYISQFSHNGFVSRRICFQNEKFNFQYFASDVHYEVDMSLLGCNSKILWHEVVQQIVDIVLISRVPVGIVMCKNIHLIHSELLEIFYSYIQEYCNPLSQVQLRFVLLSEHVSFLPNNILDVCEIVSVKRPSKSAFCTMIEQEPKLRKYDKKADDSVFDDFMHKVSCGKMKSETSEQIVTALDDVSMDHVLNIKEINHLAYEGMEGTDVFNVVCDTIIGQMLSGAYLTTGFRDALYDILIYNLDVGECLWYIYSHFIRLGLESNHVLIQMHDMLKYFNNNYRPIYHLERMMMCIIKEYTKMLGNSSNE
jgi:hypothetical protein